jgi:hypothetical protein
MLDFDQFSSDYDKALAAGARGGGPRRISDRQVRDQEAIGDDCHRHNNREKRRAAVLAEPPEAGFLSRQWRLP